MQGDSGVICVLEALRILYTRRFCARRCLALEKISTPGAHKNLCYFYDSGVICVLEPLRKKGAGMTGRFGYFGTSRWKRSLSRVTMVR